MTPDSESCDFFELKNGLISGIRDQNQKTAFFGTTEYVLAFLGGFILAFESFLWSQNSGIGPNIRNLAKNRNLTRSCTVRLATLGKTEKNQKTVLPDTFFQSDSFQHTNLLQNTF